MASIEVPAPLLAVLTDRDVPYYTPSHVDYPELQSSWASHPAQPLVIVRPKTAQDVAQIVSACVANDIEFVVRSAGHDFYGRSFAEGIVQIDVRLLNGVVLAQDKKSAWIEGGANLIDVLRALGEKNLITPVGTIGTVGYTGWATVGGYGPYVNQYGLGADQIIGARIVNAEGKLVEASERMLKGMRGGGVSNWGVAVELQVKVYPLSEVRLTHAQV
jgi:FAD/FMN-containing dehydrogenase